MGVCMPAGLLSAGQRSMAILDGSGTMRMARPSFMAGRRTALRHIPVPTLVRHTGTHDWLLLDFVLFLHNSVPDHAGAAHVTSAGEARYSFSSIT
jgi:hypothetical protein